MVSSTPRRCVEYVWPTCVGECVGLPAIVSGMPTSVGECVGLPAVVSGRPTCVGECVGLPAVVSGWLLYTLCLLGSARLKCADPCVGRGLECGGGVSLAVNTNHPLPHLCGVEGCVCGCLVLCRDGRDDY